MPTTNLNVTKSFAPIANAWDKAILIAIYIGLATTIVFSSLKLIDPLIALALRHDWVGLALRPSLIWFLMGMLLLVIRTTLWVWYRPFSAAEHSNAPRLTVVIPAYNEGAMVRRAINSCAEADYPRDRLEIIVVDDGSRDDTWTHIKLAERQYPDLVRTFRFPRNRGKRAALATGFRKASGEILVTVDSDSIVEQGALLAITGPFRDPKIGAVAGKVCVLNRFKNLLPRMLHVRFILSFDFLRSAQSAYGTVYCCPGALSAYRASVINRVLPKWEHQTFLGTVCSIGEDRALTNDTLALGYKTVYQRTAVVHTIAPETYSNLCKMYLRWDRSYIREEIRLMKIVWKFPLSAKLITLLEKTLTNLRYPVAYTSLCLMVYFSFQDPLTIMRLLLSIGIASTFYMLYYLKSERSWEFVYGIVYSYFSFFTLFWIFPYAFFTVRNRFWLTR